MSEKRAKKLVSVSTTSTSVTENSEKVILLSAKELEQVTCIQYPITFLGGVIQDGVALDLMLALLDLCSEDNAMYPAFIERLGLVVQATNVGAQKIDGTTLETYEMVVAALSVTDQANKMLISQRESFDRDLIPSRKPFLLSSKLS